MQITNTVQSKKKKKEIDIRLSKATASSGSCSLN